MSRKPREKKKKKKPAHAYMDADHVVTDRAQRNQAGMASPNRTPNSVKQAPSHASIRVGHVNKISVENMNEIAAARATAVAIKKRRGENEKKYR